MGMETDAIHADESQGAEQGLSLLCDIELDATLQFGSREMPLREVLELGPGMWWSWIGMCPSRWIWWLGTGLWREVKWWW